MFCYSTNNSREKITYVKIYQNQASLILFHALLTLRKALNIRKNISGLTQKFFLPKQYPQDQKLKKWTLTPKSI